MDGLLEGGLSSWDGVEPVSEADGDADGDVDAGVVHGERVSHMEERGLSGGRSMVLRTG